jgi:hypothetical protein
MRELTMGTSSGALPVSPWSVDVLHRTMLDSLDESFLEQRLANCVDIWRSGLRVVGTNTNIRQTPLLGRGGGDGRQIGGFWKFAHKFVFAEGSDPADVKNRCFFERYQDFAFYSKGNWLDGEKLPLVIIEAESNSKELLAELSGLLAVRSPVKYLFIAEHQGLFHRLSSYCSSAGTFATDWAGTTYFVIEIPDEPILPSKWVTYRADVNSDRGKLCFGRFPASGSDAL